MKRMIVATKWEQGNDLYHYYCSYACNNPTFGEDARQLLLSLGGNKVYTQKRSEGNGKTYQRSWYYLFPDPETYDEFKDELEDRGLSGIVQLGRLYPIVAFRDNLIVVK